MLRFFQQNSRWIVGGFLLTLFSSFGQTFFIGLSGEELREKFALSDGQFGGLYMIATLGSALTLPWLGRTLDFMPGWKVARFVIPCLAAACLLIAFAPQVWILVIALYLLRLFGQGMMTHTALTEIGRWFAANRGRATSLTVLGHQTGEAALPILFTVIALSLNWQAAWVIASIVLMVFALPVILSLWRIERTPQGDEEQGGAQHTARDWTRGEVLKDPYFFIILIGVLAPPFIGTTIFFHQDWLIEYRGYNPLVFASAFPLMAGTTIVFALIAGALIDRLGSLKLLPFFLVPLAISSLLAGLLAQDWGIYLFMVLLGVSYGFTSTLFGALWPEIYGTKYLGSVRSIIVSAMVFSTALGPGLTGGLIDMGIPLTNQLIAMSLWCLGACVLFALTAPRIIARQAQAAAN